MAYTTRQWILSAAKVGSGLKPRHESVILAIRLLSRRKLMEDFESLSESPQFEPARNPEMPYVFISYRRADTGGYAGWLHSELKSLLGQEKIFMDIANIGPGDEFAEVIEREVSLASAVIVLIGPAWLTLADEQGLRRLDDPRDWVRIEVATALQRGIHTIPMLIDGAPVPKAVELPEPLKPLAGKHCLPVTHEGFSEGISRLVQALGKSTSARTHVSTAADKRQPPSGEKRRVSGRRSGCTPARDDGQTLLSRRLGDSALTIENRDITTISAGVIVSSDDVELRAGGGVSRAITLAAGPRVIRELRDRAPVGLGEIVVTDGGGLRAEHIFHVAVLDRSQPDRTTAILIRSVTRQCLETMRSLGYHSIVFPALATGTAKLSPEQSAVAMMLEIADFLIHSPSQLSVTIALYPRAGLARDIMSRYLHEVSIVLSVVRHVEEVMTAMADLQGVHKRIGQRDEANMIATSREKLLKYRAEWERNIMGNSLGLGRDNDLGLEYYLDRLLPELFRLTSVNNHRPRPVSEMAMDCFADPGLIETGSVFRLRHVTDVSEEELAYRQQRMVAASMALLDQRDSWTAR